MPMMIDDVVEKARKRAIDKRADADWKWIHGRLNSDKEIKAAENLEQLAEWLENLKAYRELGTVSELENIVAGMAEQELYREGYNKGVDDFLAEVKDAIDIRLEQINPLSESAGNLCAFYAITDAIAKQLKEGDTE